MKETRYDVVITVDADNFGEIHQRHFEENVTLSMAMSEAQRQAEFIGEGSVKDIHIAFCKRT